MKVIKGRARALKKGITIMEVVIAIAVITIITTAAIGLLTRAIAIEADNLRGVEIARHAENAVECFRYCDNDSDLISLLKETGLEYSGADGNYTVEKPTYKITIEIDGNKIEFTATDNDGKEIYTLSYTKT